MAVIINDDVLHLAVQRPHFVDGALELGAGGRPEPRVSPDHYGMFTLPQSTFHGSTLLRQIGYMTLLGLGVELAGGLLRKLFK